MPCGGIFAAVADDDIVRSARRHGDPAPLVAAAANASSPRERARLSAAARLLGADAHVELEHVDAEGAAWIARAHLIALDGDAARPWIARVDDPIARARMELWCEVLEGGDPRESFDELRRRARAAERSDEVIELTALEALAALEARRDDDATSLARRAARMAATEELPDSAFLSHLVLARVRRVSGRPHLATHILATLARYAPKPWHRWLAWELTFSFGRHDALPEAPPEAAAAVAAAVQGGSAPAPALHRRDLETLAALSAPFEPSDDEAVRGFREGRMHEVPRGLHGIAALEAQGAVAWVAVARGDAARTLALGLPALERDGFRRLEQSHRHQGRADILLAAIALAGEEGLSEEALFEACYGFAYEAALHAGPLGVALHRARGRLEGLGQVERAAGQMRFLPAGALLLADPRCAVGTEDRALQHIAGGGAATARALATALGVSLRSAQQALEALVRAGLCDREREGNAVRYRIEDTTFHEPTQLERPRTLLG